MVFFPVLVEFVVVRGRKFVVFFLPVVGRTIAIYYYEPILVTIGINCSLKDGK